MMHSQSTTVRRNHTEVSVLLCCPGIYRHFSGMFEPPHKPLGNNDSLRSHDGRLGLTRTRVLETRTLGVGGPTRCWTTHFLRFLSSCHPSPTREDDMGICCHSKEAAARNEEPAVHFSNVREEQMTDNRVIAVALYPLQSTNRFLLNFERGDKLIIDDDSDPDWYMARHINEERRGFVPKSYLNLDQFAGEERWFFGDTNRADAERLLLQPENEPGAFLVRHSHAQGSYALSIKDIDTNANEVLIRHYKIRTLDRGGFFISPRDSFATLKDLVSYYSTKFEEELKIIPYPRHHWVGQLTSWVGQSRSWVPNLDSLAYLLINIYIFAYPILSYPPIYSTLQGVMTLGSCRGLADTEYTQGKEDRNLGNSSGVAARVLGRRSGAACPI
ncbi:Tyrosine-protein kinase Lyn [Araneus ventricosus]|uniref:Tyrosine-protein kinase Lyn n=1 Tax=Araneus ventricosus TaxID=182803 RepID=A0A4Y2JB04_ARAVE|nr:Tyrosine-protein kinase Lyn [Araneus ventricosus]